MRKKREKLSFWRGAILIICMCSVLFGTACGKSANNLEKYPVGDITPIDEIRSAITPGDTPLIVYDDAPYLSEITFNAEVGEGCILEAWDGEVWRILYSDWQSIPGAVTFQYTLKDGVLTDVNLENLAAFGTGNYRILAHGSGENAWGETTDDQLFYRRDIRILSAVELEEGRSLADLLDVSETIYWGFLQQEGTNVDLPWEDFKELGMEALSCSCVGRMGRDVGAADPASRDFHFCLILDHNTIVHIYNESGVTAEGVSYNAVCAVNGLEEYLLLSVGEEWWEKVLDYPEK
ncbi:MAG: hypothetical protein J1E83_01530 [Lachnospiraceae bacterium]|nr:hypothetical protein [Lachnospiraceae bacterium]